MRQSLVWAVVIVAAVACAVSEVIVFRMTSPPDATAAVLGGLWIAMPFLGAAGLAALVRRHTAALVTLLIALLIVAPVGLFVYNAAAIQQEVAVQPGEDPDSGPGAVRRGNAELFSILLAVKLPPVQLAAVFFPTLIAYGVSALRRRPQKAETRDLVSTGA